MKKTKEPQRASRRTAPHCSHLLGTVMRTVGGQHIIVYVTDWEKAASYKVTDRFNYCPKCGKLVNANEKVEFSERSEASER